mmetsp:Transcript_3496/g.8297  ORF Transcript_3496/g.8297 Transcript_3496/m.8297 type:complete len:233 (+) Transcript_3496:1378-2076(+)
MKGGRCKASHCLVNFFIVPTEQRSSLQLQGIAIQSLHSAEPFNNELVCRSAPAPQHILHAPGHPVVGSGRENSGLLALLPGIVMQHGKRPPRKAEVEFAESRFHLALYVQHETSIFHPLLQDSAFWKPPPAFDNFTCHSSKAVFPFKLLFNKILRLPFISSFFNCKSPIEKSCLANASKNTAQKIPYTFHTKAVLPPVRKGEKHSFVRQPRKHCTSCRQLHHLLPPNKVCPM